MYLTFNKQNTYAPFQHYILATENGESDRNSSKKYLYG